MRSRIVTCVLGLVCAPLPAHAQRAVGGSIDLQAFRPALDSRGFITVDASSVLGHRELSFGLVTSWGRGVLELEGDGARYEVDNVITPTLVAAFGLRLGRAQLELGASLPFAIVSGDRDPDDDGGTPPDPNDDRNFQFSGQGLGDVGVHAKLRLLNTSTGRRIGLAVIGSLFLPTATQSEAWLGEGSFTPQAMIVVDRELAGGQVRAAVNAGVRIRTGDHRFVDAPVMSTEPGVPMTNQTIEAKTTLPVGVGLAYAISPQRLDLVGEVFGELPLGGENFMPLEAVAGIKVYLARNSFLTLGGGAGLLGAMGGNPDARAFVGIVFEPNVGDRDRDGLADDVDQCPDDPEDHDDFEDADGCPDLDNDRDQIFDRDDACPNEPEDRDGIDDGDGCPETNATDRDGDRIADDLDRCPDDPEDHDGFEDADGCPDVDNDGDSILDVDDLCENDPEDYDEWDDTDGCPDPDNDHDRILDVDDSCPDEPENYNNYLDTDGCPDRDVVRMGKTELELLDKIHFEYDSAVIKPQSFPILDAVARTLDDHGDITLVEVQGHTDERGSAPYNLKLSDDRAHAVVWHLVEFGVDAGRLRARGYGETVPLDRGHGEEAWATNRRVQFVIEARAE